MILWFNKQLLWLDTSWAVHLAACSVRLAGKRGSVNSRFLCLAQPGGLSVVTDGVAVLRRLFTRLLARIETCDDYFCLACCLELCNGGVICFCTPGVKKHGCL